MPVSNDTDNGDDAITEAAVEDNSHAFSDRIQELSSSMPCHHYSSTSGVGGHACDLLPTIRRSMLREEMDRIKLVMDERRYAWEAELAIYEGSLLPSSCIVRPSQTPEITTTTDPSWVSEVAQASLSPVIPNAGEEAIGKDCTKNLAAVEAATATKNTDVPFSVDGPGAGKRNYPNPAGVVEDPQLFPYCDALYSLLESYDTPPRQLDNEHEVENSMPTPASALRKALGVLTPSQPISFFAKAAEAFVEGNLEEDNDDEVYDDNQEHAYHAVDSANEAWTSWLDSSLLPLSSWLLSRSLNRSWQPRRRTRGGMEVHVDVDAEGDGDCVNDGKDEDEDEESDRAFGPSRCEDNDDVGVHVKEMIDGNVLLRVLRHATSDLQRDHVLAAATLLCMTKQFSFDDVDCLRGVIAVIDSDYPCECDATCHHHRNAVHHHHHQQQHGVGVIVVNNQDDDDDDVAVVDDELPNHSCLEVSLYLQAVAIFIAAGISRFTREHAVIMSSWVLMELGEISADSIDDAFFDAIFEEEEDDGHRRDGKEMHRSSANGSKSTCLNRKDVEGRKSGIGMARSSSSSLSGRYNGSGVRGGGGSDCGFRLDRRKILLKQNLYHYGTVPVQFKGRLLKRIIEGLGWHAALDRMRLFHIAEWKKSSEERQQGLQLNGSRKRGANGCDYHNDFGVDEKEILGREFLPGLDETRDSWTQCVSALLNIAQSCLRRLPQNEIAAELGGMLLAAFVRAYITHEDKDEKDCIQGYLGHHSILNYNRYAQSVVNASDKKYDANSCVALSGVPAPSEDVRDVVRALFVRDLVDINVSRCGYGDWLYLCSVPVTPYDPLVFDHESNYVSSSAGTVDGSSMSYKDEDGEEVTGERLAARYDASLVMLNRAWRAPWTPQSHRSYQPLYRVVAYTVALCLQRSFVPSDIVNQVISFVPRDWFSDVRRRCWYYDCMLKDTINGVRAKMKVGEVVPLQINSSGRDSGTATSSKDGGGSSDRSVTIPVGRRQGACQRFTTATHRDGGHVVRSCKGCRLALYCSKEHRKWMMQDGHKRVCGNPPYRVPGKEEERLVQTLMQYDVERRRRRRGENDDDESRGGTDSDVFGGVARISRTDVTLPDLSNNQYEFVEGGDLDDDNDDDSSWESLSTHEEGEEEGNREPTRTDVIYKFFEKFYKQQRHEPPAFANFFGPE